MMTVFALVLAPAHAEPIRIDPLRIDIGMGAVIGLPHVDVGFALSVDPKWSVSDHMAAGLHLEKSHFFSSDEDDESHYEVHLLQPTVELYALDGSIRPFLGLGLGLYKLQEGGVLSFYAADSEKALTLGLGAQVGVELGRYHLSGTFHLLQQSVQIAEDELRAYVSIDHGFRFGGNRND
jgi:hypothetical protein